VQDLLCWVLQRKENGRMVESKYPLPADWGPPRSMAYRERYPREFPGEDNFLYVCGSQGMVEAVVKTLRGMGIPDKQIQYEQLAF